MLRGLVNNHRLENRDSPQTADSQPPTADSRPVGTSRLSAEESWNDYWNRCPVSDQDFVLLDFRRILLDALTRELNDRAGQPVRMLNAGCGLDPLPVHLLPRFPLLDISLLDLSEQCLARNRDFLMPKLTPEAQARLHLQQGNAFALGFEPESFDVVYHTGVIEHFLADDQVRILSEIARVLKPGGSYLSLNPCSRGRLYVAMKRYLEAHGRWEFGPEYPVHSLRRPAQAAFRSFAIRESNLDFKFSAWMLTKHDNRRIAWLGDRLTRLASRPFFERLFRSLLGGYILLTRIKKA